MATEEVVYKFTSDTKDLEKSLNNVKSLILDVANLCKAQVAQMQGATSGLASSVNACLSQIGSAASGIRTDFQNLGAVTDFAFNTIKSSATTAKSIIGSMAGDFGKLSSAGSTSVRTITEEFNSGSSSINSFSNHATSASNSFSANFKDTTGITAMRAEMDNTSGSCGGLSAKFLDLSKKTEAGIGVSSSYAENSNQMMSMSSQCQNMKRTITETTGATSSLGNKALSVASVFGKGLGLLALGGIALSAFGLLQGSFGSSIDGLLQSASEKGPQIIMGLVNGILAALPNLMAQGAILINNLLMALNANLPAIITGGMQILVALITGVATALPTLIPTILTVMMTIITQLIANLPLIITAGINLLMGLISGLVAALPLLITYLPTLIQTIVDTLVQNLPMIIEGGIQLITGLINGIVAAIPMIITYLPTLIQTIVDTLIANMPIIIEGGIQLLVGIINGIMAALPILIGYLPTIISTLINTIITYLPMIIKLGIDLLMKLAAGLIQAIPELVAQIPQIISSIIDAFKDMDLLDIGKNLIKGLWDGISNMGKWVLDKIADFGNTILKGIKGVLGIHSPSIYTYKMGVFVDKGFINGIESMDREVNKAFGSIFSLSPSLYGSATNRLSPNVKVINNISMEQDPLGQMVRRTKTYSSGAKNSFNYGGAI